ncbi:16S rRNA (cytosine(967)-C(5))-methyltransferase RsmB [Candidatus Arthromitus sp. SFB-rat-Yit]|uniref:16S rRNA (cytosine(967)-C(5))-methyltransferase RsmB n=1 Tax=Candidatus Arthromitus sp. SFB-rat-Yit TaxID=1041504 RepID=UPI000227A64F|nr:16S rRNA (cytosine(967)-C(5))-methyltransferase RsmB [Candidatus Arthromitus sp. SFB-rat-Yit]BAK81062.1 ribosomal RNA small subunit methyltransferase B [Candidatus Arthromitus sp. SFB-rat-Yit]
MINNLRYDCVIILNNVLNGGAYSNITLKDYLDKSDLKYIDKKLVTEIVYGTIRYKLTIDGILSKFVKKLDQNDISTIILRSAIYQLKYLDKIPEYSVLNESVEVAKKLCRNKSGFVNGVLRSYLRNKKLIDGYKNTLQYEYSFSSWMIKLFKDQYSKNYISLMEALNKRSETCYRVNSKIISKKDFIEKFGDEFKIEDIDGFKNAIKIKSLINISQSELYKNSFISVQGLSSQVACEILNPIEDDVIIDLCAAPGGKSTYIAELSKDKCKIISCDVYDHRIELIKNSARRLKLNSIDYFINDATILNEKFIDKADKVLVDAPCSGLGVINKKPEIKWFKNISDLKEIINIQRKIILNASRYVKSSGVLMYTTCTLNKNENEEIIKWFLRSNSDFVVEEIEDYHFGNLYFENENGMVTIFPSEVNNGFFITKLRKN